MKNIDYIIIISILFNVYLSSALADSVNSPNITLNADTNRATSTGTGAGNASVTINTITIAETMLPEYSSGGTKKITLSVKPGYQFDSSSNITAQSATIGLNGGGINAVATVVPAGTANETITFSLTSGTQSNVQDIIRVNGVKIRIISALGAAGPAQTTMNLTTSTAGGAFTDQGLVAANITRGAAHHLAFSAGITEALAGSKLLPEVKVQDFGNNILTSDTRTISLDLSSNPTNTTLNGITERQAVAGVAKWTDADNLNITAAGTYVLRAQSTGASLLDTASTTSSLVIDASDPGKLSVTTQPVETSAGGDILITVTALDQFDNVTNISGLEVSLDSAVNPGGWPLLVDTSTRKTTTNGVVSWLAADHLRINKAISNYKLSVSGLGTPITTNAFNIIPAGASILRFTSVPDFLVEEKAADLIGVEVTDIFGNRISTAEKSITLAIDGDDCTATLSGNVQNTSSGLAEFSTLAADAPCENINLLASAENLTGVASEELDIKAKDSFPIALKSAQFQKGKNFTFSAKGAFTVSSKATDDPTKNGATLTVSGTTGSVTYALSKKGWKKNGKKGFSFTGKKCQNVNLRSNLISATCSSKTGTLKLPEEGPLNIVFSVGSGTEEYCGKCGGTSQGNALKIFKRTDCEKPETCP